MRMGCRYKSLPGAQQYDDDDGSDAGQHGPDAVAHADDGIDDRLITCSDGRNVQPNRLIIRSDGRNVQPDRLIIRGDGRAVQPGDQLDGRNDGRSVQRDGRDAQQHVD